MVVTGVVTNFSLSTKLDSIVTHLSYSFTYSWEDHWGGYQGWEFGMCHGLLCILGLRCEGVQRLAKGLSFSLYTLLLLTPGPWKAIQQTCVVELEPRTVQFCWHLCQSSARLGFVSCYPLSVAGHALECDPCLLGGCVHFLTWCWFLSSNEVC